MHGTDAGQLASALLRAGAGRAGEAAAGESPALSANEVAAATGGKLGYPAWSKHAVYNKLRWGWRAPACLLHCRLSLLVHLLAGERLRC